MSKIIKPGEFQAMSVWLDAFTAMLESTAEARNNFQLQKEVKESVRELSAEAKRLGTVEMRTLANNQKAIARQMAFDPEQHALLMARWKLCKYQLLKAGWDMSQEIFFQPLPSGKMKVWQGEEKSHVLFSEEDGKATVAFLHFVRDNSEKFDPIEYTKQMLLKQGINAKNFHEYQDKLAITNPWKPIL